MSEVEKQESQKTVVAFITGLLIGGLLVWVFSSTPEEAKQPVVETGDEKSADITKQEGTSDEEKKSESVASVEYTGEGKITVTDQKAGALVALGALTFPAKSGWVVVRDYKDMVPGNVLGAARFNSDEGLVPTSVELIRNTVAGNTYQIVFYSNTGAIDFKLGEDTVIDGPSASFKAQ